MAKSKNLEDLFIDELKDIYNAEGQLIKALPSMAKKANSDKLRQALEDHLEETKEQKERLDKVFAEVGKKAVGKKCVAMEGLVKEGKEIMQETVTNEFVLDAGIISAAQKVEHYEIASYGTLVEYAKRLGYDKAAQLLQKNLDEEKNADKKLTKLAVNSINQKAMSSKE
jgi:ferritin-like metal-binding protein YciE